MTAAPSRDARIINGLRVAGWTSAAALLALPAVAMQFTNEVVWTATDFLAFGALLAVAGGLMELAARSRNLPHVLASALAVGAGFLLVWSSLAVGINGEGADLLYAGVLGVGLLGSIAAGFRSSRMALAMLATAAAQAAAAAASFQLGFVPASETPMLLGVNGVFVALFLGSAWLYSRAAKT